MFVRYRKQSFIVNDTMPKQVSLCLTLDRLEISSYEPSMTKKAKRARPLRQSICAMTRNHQHRFP